MLAAAAAARNFGHQGQFQSMRLDLSALNAAAAGYFGTSDVGSFGASGSGQSSGAGQSGGASHGPGGGGGGGWNRR